MSRAADIAALVDRYVDLDPDEAAPLDRLPLCTPPYGRAEVAAAIESLLAGELTMGRRVRAFEATWAEACGVKQAVMVNSGSSALLVMLAALVEIGALEPGEELVVPAVT